MKKVILVVVVIICFFSCHKDDEAVISKVTTSSYLPMAVGNYWVYQEYTTQNNGTFVPSSAIDSVCISKDTIINGKTFYKFDSFQIYASLVPPIRVNGSDFYSDSCKNLINPKGEIMFSEDNFTDILLRRSDVIQEDTFTWITGKMEKLDQIVTVPAGTFNDVLNLKGTVNCNPKFSSVSNPRYVNKYLAKNVGEILHSYIFVDVDITIEKRLIRYKIYK